jgi:hypothetical protein
VAGADGIIRIHVPFSMTDRFQIEKRLGSFSNDSASYIKEFKYLTKAYDMTWHDIYAILSSTLTLVKRKEFGWQPRHMPMTSTAHISLSRWDLWLCHVTTHIGTIRTPPCWPSKIICSPVSLQGYRLLPIGQSILTNLVEIIQCPTENPADFLGCLTEALTHYTKLDPSSKDRIIILNFHFISQSFPDYLKKT